MKLEFSQQQATYLLELSIRDLFLQYFDVEYSHMGLRLRSDQSLLENIDRLTQNGVISDRQVEDAMRYAYDSKYGDWDSVNDLRKLFPTTWYESINGLFINVSNSSRVIDIGCNDGRELKDLFGPAFTLPHITLVDISKKALGHVADCFSSDRMTAINEPFMKCNLSENYFDYCISLRALHSSGLDTVSAVTKCYSVTKQGGLIVLSVSNGYIDDVLKEPVYGMFDPETRTLDEKKPHQIAAKVSETLELSGAVDVRILDGKCEVFVVAIKG